MKGKLTKYQVELLGHLSAARARGDEVLDFDELLPLLSWEPTKEAAQFSMRALIKRGLVAKRPALMLRRGRLRVCFELTQEGVLALDPRPALPAPAGADAEAPGVIEALPADDDFFSGMDDLAPGVVLSVEEG